MNYIEQYVDEIRSGRIVVSKRVRRVYERLASEIQNPSGQFVFSEKKAQRPIEFIERFCRHSKGKWAGQKIELLLFQKAFISALFGFVHKDTGLRRFKEAFLYMARKNGKTSLAAAIALYCLVADGEAGAEVYSVATKRDQAKILFDEALNTAKQSPDLQAVLRKRKTDLYFEATLSKMAPLGRNADSLDGLNASLAVIDEMHAVRGREIYDVLRQSQSARQQPILLTITTAGTRRGDIFDELYGYTCSVADGTIQDDNFLPVLYELDDQAEYKNPAMWQKSNPALGEIKTVADLAEKIERAKHSPSELSAVLCKDLNVNQTTSTAWLSWEDVNNEDVFSLEDFHGTYAIGGVDLSLTTDLTCASILLARGDKIYVHQMYWFPEDCLAQRMAEKVAPYDKWRQMGLLRLCKGNTINPDDVMQWFLELVNEYEITPLWIYYDSYSARYFVESMETAGFRMARCLQGAKTLSGPMQQLGADLAAKKINYNNNPLLKWCLSNVCTTEDRNGNIVPVKRRNPAYRIDGFSSLLDAYVGLCDHKSEFLELSK